MYAILLLQMLLLSAMLLPLLLVRRRRCSVLKLHASLVEHVVQQTRPAQQTRPVVPPLLLRKMRCTFIRQQHSWTWRRRMIRTPRRHDQVMRTCSPERGFMRVTTGISSCWQLRGAGDVDDMQRRQGW